MIPLILAALPWMVASWVLGAGSLMILDSSSFQWFVGQAKQTFVLMLVEWSLIILHIVGIFKFPHRQFAVTMIGGTIFIVALILRVVDSSSRAQRAQSKGYIRTALRIHTKANDVDQIRRLLSELPDLPVRALLITAAEELLQLGSSITIAQRAGVSQKLTEQFARRAQTATDALWGRAERLAAVGAQKIDYAALAPHLDRESQTLQQLISSTQKNREVLAALTLSGESREALEDAEMQLRAFGQVIANL